MRTIEEPPAKGRIPMRRTFCTLFRTAAAGVLALLLAAAAVPDPALADECVYNDGSSDLGPCMQFENGMPLSTDRNLDLYCQQGPTPSSQKIVMRPGDDFTCKVENRNTPAAVTDFNNTRFSWNYRCGIGSTQKNKVRLYGDAYPDFEERWRSSCHDTQ